MSRLVLFIILFPTSLSKNISTNRPLSTQSILSILQLSINIKICHGRTGEMVIVIIITTTGILCFVPGDFLLFEFKLTYTKHFSTILYHFIWVSND